MSVYTIVFSPTGGTKKVGDCLGRALGPEVQEIDLTNPAAEFSSFLLGSKDICVVSVPSFGGRVPAPAAARLAELKANGAKACISCMRCVSICPAQARTLNKLLLAGVSQKLKKVCSEPKKNELFLS